ncbi:hypothetical protein J4Q44_G00107730 [Coregonus suidteri]|uniref:Uncharacterized protein n=1 Tax=Coregonus suidteri TaxID=861788 RepID=A0AAN8M1X7_9TELE
MLGSILSSPLYRPRFCPQALLKRMESHLQTTILMCTTYTAQSPTDQQPQPSRMGCTVFCRHTETTPLTFYNYVSQKYSSM